MAHLNPTSNPSSSVHTDSWWQQLAVRSSVEAYRHTPTSPIQPHHSLSGSFPHLPTHESPPLDYSTSNPLPPRYRSTDLAQFKPDKTTIPLFVTLLIPSLVLACSFFGLSWLFLHGTTSDSLNKMTHRVHEVTELHLHRRIDDFLYDAMCVTQMAHAFLTTQGKENVNQSVEDVHATMVKTLNASTVSSYKVSYGKQTGQFVAVEKNAETGGFQAFTRDCVLDGSASPHCSNLTIWNLTSEGQWIASGAASSQFDPRDQDWYKVVMARQAPSFSTLHTDFSGLRKGLF